MESGTLATLGTLFDNEYGSKKTPVTPEPKVESGTDDGRGGTENASQESQESPEMAFDGTHLAQSAPSVPEEPAN